jgi:hypothetical protein
MNFTSKKSQALLGLALLSGVGCAADTEQNDSDYTNVRPGIALESSLLWEKAADGEDTTFLLDQQKVKFGEKIALASGRHTALFKVGRGTTYKDFEVTRGENLVWKPMGAIEMRTDAPLTEFPKLSVGNANEVWADKMLFRHPEGTVSMHSGPSFLLSYEVVSNEVTRVTVPTSTIVFDVEPGRLTTTCPNRIVHVLYGKTFLFEDVRRGAESKFVVPYHESLNLNVEFDVNFKAKFPVTRKGMTTIKLPRLDVEDYEIVSGGTTKKVRGTFTVTSKNGVAMNGCEGTDSFKTNSGLNLPEGEYRVRVNAPGQPERIYDVTL